MAQIKRMGSQTNHRFLHVSTLELIEWEAEQEAIEDFSNGTAMLRVPDSRTKERETFEINTVWRLQQ